ncbi:hypothetical protein CPB84DRAFT_1949271, partial [Gymnopilus junonius]
IYSLTSSTFAPLYRNYEGARKGYREQCLKEFARNWLEPDRSDMNMARRIYCDYWDKKFLLGSRKGYTAENECICPPLAIQLLTVCRSVSQEVLEILYSKNKFKLYLDPISTFPLEPKSVARMTSLCIRLNFCSCVPHHFCEHPWSDLLSERCTVCHLMCRRGKDAPFSAETSDGIDLMNRWIDICGILQASLRPERWLSVICDCADMAAAQMVVQPMRILPKVAEFSIRLGQSPFIEWRNIAEDTVLLLTDCRGTRSEPFRFLDLPKELQRDILCRTDLVSQYILDVNGYLNEYHSRRGIEPFEQGDTTCCLQCSDAADACCCPSNHAAFSSVQCTCWVYPAALFQVSKDIWQEAMVIFFSKNKFIIWEEPWPLDKRPGMRQALSFFKKLPPLALENLRWIRFNLIGDYPLDVPEGSIPLAGWKEMAKFVADKMDTRKLTVELDLRYDHEDPDVYDIETEVQREKNWKSYQNMAEVFYFKDGLKDFFVHLASPYEIRGVIDARVRKERERILEKRIMGEGYDSHTRGKFTNRGVSVSDVTYQQLYGSFPSRSGE